MKVPVKTMLSDGDKVIVLNFSSPIQSWAGPSVIKTRVETRREPSSQAIMGLLCACFGVSRGDFRNKNYPDALKGLKITVKVLNQGQIIRDFQTITARPDEEFFRQKVGRIFVKGNQKPPEWVTGKTTTVVERTYIADAHFLVK